MSLPIVLLLVACAAAAYTDVRTRRIPNLLVGSLALAAVLVHAFAGIGSAAESVAVMLLVTLLGTLVYSLGGIGGGDIKLAVAASGMLGYPLCVPFLLYTMLGGGLLALICTILRGSGASSLSRIALITIGGPQAVGVDKTQTMPYAIAFAFGAILIALSQSAAPFLRMTL